VERLGQGWRSPLRERTAAGAIRASADSHQQRVPGVTCLDETKRLWHEVLFSERRGLNAVKTLKPAPSPNIPTRLLARILNRAFPGIPAHS